MLDVIILASTGIALVCSVYSVYLNWSQMKEMRRLESSLDILDKKILDLVASGQRTLISVYNVEDHIYRAERQLQALKPLSDIEAAKNNLATAKSNVDYWNGAVKSFAATLKDLKKGNK